MKYIPILRLGTVEAKLLEGDLNGLNIFPLLEITHKKTLKDWSGRIARHYKGDYMVDLPFYLLYTKTKHSERIESIINSIQPNEKTKNFSTQARFYIENKKWIKIPVASSGEDIDDSYDQVLITLNELKAEFPRVAIRIFVSHTQLTPRRISKLDVIFKNLRKDDIILLDIIGFEGIEQPVLANIQKIIGILPESNEKYLLNVFDIKTNRGEVRNYGPLLAKQFSFNGFGDFATSIRYEPTGGTQGKKIIRYYVGDVNNKLVHYPYDTFSESLNKLKKSGYWADAIKRGHNGKCLGCQYADSVPNEGLTFWKNYRILHYIFSILHDTMPRMAKHNNPQDLDPDGFFNLAKAGGNLQGDQVAQ